MKISKENIIKNLQTRYVGKTIYSFNTIDSTNIFAKSLSNEEAPNGSIVISEEQTAGRGRLQRNWLAEKEKNLLFTVILYPDFGIEKISILPFAAALAVCEGIEKSANVSCQCKWPNDILVNGRKICGMLLESIIGPSSSKKIVVGIGINVNQNKFENDLLYKATSLFKETMSEINREILLQNILEALEDRLAQISRFSVLGILQEWKERTTMFGSRITVMENEFSYEATARDIAEDGSLVIEFDDKTKKHLFAGDVSLTENYSLKL